MLFPGLLTAIMSYIRKGEHLYTHDRVLDISVTELYAMLIMLKLLLITNKPNSPPGMYVMCVCVFLMYVVHILIGKVFIIIPYAGIIIKPVCCRT
jgi:hypothetical protein